MGEGTGLQTGLDALMRRRVVQTAGMSSMPIRLATACTNGDVAWGLIRESTGVLHDIPPLKRAGRASLAGGKCVQSSYTIYIW